MGGPVILIFISRGLFTVKGADDSLTDAHIGEEGHVGVKLAISDGGAAALHQRHGVGFAQILQIVGGSGRQHIIIAVDQAGVVGEVFAAHDYVDGLHRALALVLDQRIVGDVAGVGLQGGVSAGRILLHVIGAVRMAAEEQLFVGHAVQLILVDDAHEALHEVELHIGLIFLQVDDDVAAVDLHIVDGGIAVGPGAVGEAVLQRSYHVLGLELLAGAVIHALGEGQRPGEAVLRPYRGGGDARESGAIVGFRKDTVADKALHVVHGVDQIHVDAVPFGVDHRDGIGDLQVVVFRRVFLAAGGKDAQDHRRSHDQCQVFFHDSVLLCCADYFFIFTHRAKRSYTVSPSAGRVSQR